MHVGITTHKGYVRPNNEDAYFAQFPWLAVADGMGGHEAGEVASAAAVAALARHASDAAGDDPARCLQRAFLSAHRRLAQFGADNEGLRNMGTTLTAAFVGSREIHVAHVGDSRAYLWRDGELRLLTADHSVTGELVRAGQLDARDAVRHPQRHVLTRAVSGGKAQEADMIVTERRRGDALLLCTDGLTVHVSDETIRRVLRRKDDPQAAADELVRLALDGGGSDNVTVIVARAALREVIR